MKNLAVIIFVVLNSTFAYSQGYVFTKQWDKRYGWNKTETPLGVLQARNGAFLISGYSLSGIGGDKSEDNRNPSLGTSDFWIIKINENGAKEWDKRYGTVANEYLIKLLPTSDGGYLLGGLSNGGIDGDKSEPSRGGKDYWIVKIDSEGHKLWDKRYGGSGDESLTCMYATTDGGYILGGTSPSGIGGDKTQDNWDATHFYFDYWILKIDSMGIIQWDKRYGGLKDDILRTITQTIDGGYILGGESNSRIGGDKTQDNWYTGLPEREDWWIVKTDASGNLQWEKRLGTVEDDLLYAVTNMPDSTVLLTGASFYNGVNGDKTTSILGNWFVMIDLGGTIIWQKSIYTGSGDECVSQTKDGGYIVSGIGVRNATTPPALDRSENCLGEMNTVVFKLDSNGLKLWDKVIFTTGYDYKGYVTETTDGCYIVANSSKADTGGYKTQAAWDSSYDFFVVKFCMEPYNGIFPATAGESFGLSVYPNPFVTDVAISVQKENLREATFTISNSLGQIIYQREENNLSQGYTKMLDLRYLPKGLYFITVEADGERVVRRVVKE